jgi:hypothetical protein
MLPRPIFWVFSFIYLITYRLANLFVGVFNVMLDNRILQETRL